MLSEFHELNKKVLLREHKRHTARRVVSTPSVVLTGYHPVLTWQGGTLPGGVPHLGTSHPGLGGTLLGGTLLGGTLPGYPHPDLAGYPPVYAPWHSG